MFKQSLSEQCMNLGMLHECNAISGHCIIMYLSNVKPERTDDWHIWVIFTIPTNWHLTIKFLTSINHGDILADLT